MVGFYNISVILTYLSAAVAIYGCQEAIQGRIDVAAVCLIISGICDIFDGKVARMIKRTPQESEFGIQIDSLADVVSFSVLPAIIGIKIEIPIWICIIYVLSAVIRLGYYNVKGLSNGYYSGLPVTFSAMFIPLLICVSVLFKINLKLIYSLLIAILAIMFISPIHIKKPQKGILIGIIIIELTMLVFLLLTL